MGIGSSRRNPVGGQYGVPGTPPLSERDRKKLLAAYQTINSFQNRGTNMQQGIGGMGPPYGGPPIMNPPSLPLGGSSMSGGSGGQNFESYPGYRPPSPILQRAAGLAPSPPMHSFGNTGYRDSDYAAVANISGLNPQDVALLHREYLNLTRGGTNKIDRVVFRQILREAVVQANNEQVDRTIENIFLSIDKNHDGFIDFPEFVGAFRDVLRGSNDPLSNQGQNPFSSILSDPNRQSPYASNNLSQPLALMPSTSGQIMPGNIQSPLVYGSSAPLVISLDSNQPAYTSGMPGQPITLQCIPLSQ